MTEPKNHLHDIGTDGPATSPHSPLEVILQKAQVIADNTSTPWQTNIIQQAENVLYWLQHLLTILMSSTMYNLVETKEGPTGEDYELNIWLRLVVLAASGNEETYVDHYTKIAELSLKLLHNFRTNLKTFSSKIKQLHRIYNENASQVLTSTTVASLILDETEQRNSEDPLNSKKISAVCVLTIINRKIILEYSSENLEETFRLVLPTGDPSKDYSILEEFLNHLLKILSRGNDGIRLTSESLIRNSSDFEESISKLITTLKRHKDHSRLRATVCSNDTTQALVLVDSRLVEITKILNEITCNVNRVVGVVDFLSGSFISNVDPFLEVLRNSQLLKPKWWWPFNKTRRILKFRDNAKIEAEDFLSEVLLAGESYENSYQLYLPITPQLSNIIRLRYDETETISENGTPEKGEEENNLLSIAHKESLNKIENGDETRTLQKDSPRTSEDDKNSITLEILSILESLETNNSDPIIVNRLTEPAPD